MKVKYPKNYFEPYEDFNYEVPSDEELYEREIKKYNFNKMTKKELIECIKDLVYEKYVSDSRFD